MVAAEADAIGNAYSRSEAFRSCLERFRGGEGAECLGSGSSAVDVETQMA